MAASEPERTVVTFANPNPQMARVENESVIYSPAEHLNQSVTSVAMWAGFDDPDQVDATLSTDNDRMLVMIARELGADLRRYTVGVGELEHVVAHHAAGSAPAWVDSSDPEFAVALGKHFGCAVGTPVALLTTAGRDALHAQHLGTGAQPAAFNYLALSTSTATELASNTSLPGEIVTAGLARAQATVAHTAGTNVTTLTRTFTAVSADVAGGAVVVAKVGVLNASSSGTFGYERLLTSTATISVVGDSVTLTDTLTGG